MVSPAFEGLVVSPGRKQYSFIATRTAGPIPHDLFLQAASSGPARDVTSAIDRAVLNARWQNDSTIMILVADGFRNRILRIDSNGLTVPVDLPDSVRAFDVVSDGTPIFAGVVGFNRLPELLIRRIDGTIAQVSHLQQGWEGVQLADAEVFRFKSFDGTEI
ncbi:MAG TPA: hypothetical protein VIX14_08350 [Terriglobales bacterium]